MIVQCTNCRARFRVADDKVPDRGIKVRCTKCATVFRVTKADAVESTGRQTASRDAFGLGGEPTPAPRPTPRPSPDDFDLGLDLGGLPAPASATPRPGHPGRPSERTTAPAPARAVIKSMPRAPSAIDAAFDAALASGTDPFADLGFEAPAPPPPASPAPAREDPFAVADFASSDPFARLSAQASQPAARPASFDDDPFAAPEPRQQTTPFSAPAVRELTDPFAAAAGDHHDPFASTAPFADGPHDPFGELPPAPGSQAAAASDFGDLADAPSEKLPQRNGAQEFDFAESSTGGSLDLNLAAVGLSDPSSNRTQVGQLNLAAKVADRPVTSRQSATRTFRREVASALFNVTSACIVGFAALVAIASLRSPRALTADDLGFDLVWIAMGYTQPEAEGSELRAVNISSGTYLTRSGQELFYVRGDAENGSAAQRAAVHVAIEVVRSGDLLGRAEALGHLAAGPEDLFALDSRDNNALQRRLAANTTSLSLPARGRAPFLAVFPLGASQVDGAELRVSVVEGIPPTLADAVKVARPGPQDAPPAAAAGEPEPQ